MIAYVQLDKYKLSNKLSQFTIKTKIFYEAMKGAFAEVQKMTNELNAQCSA
jgi:hypothetical protein